MAKMTLTDLLPGILGLVGGAVSPQAGQAGAATLEMADAFKQRRRRQGIEDEQLERARKNQAMSEEAFQQSKDRYNWAKEDQVRQTLEQQRVDEERARAVNALGKAKEGLIKEGYTIPVEFENWVPDTEEAVIQATDKIRSYSSETPIDGEAADRLSAELKARGQVRYGNVRRNGVVGREMMGGYPQSTRSGLPEGTTTLFNQRQAIDAAGLSLEQATEDVHEKTSEEFSEGREAAGVDGAIKVGFEEGDTAAAAEDLLRSETVPDTSQEWQAVETKQLTLQQAIQDFITTGTLRPEALQLFLQANANSMGQSAGVAPTAAGSTKKEPSVRPDVVGPIIDKYRRK